MESISPDSELPPTVVLPLLRPKMLLAPNYRNGVLFFAARLGKDQ